jgi:hypothetical protein
LANRVGVVASANRTTPTSIFNPSINAIQTSDSRNNNPPHVIRPKTISRSSSIGIQLWHHSNQHRNQTPRGIDNAVKDRLPLVCGVLWRSIAPTQPVKAVEQASLRHQIEEIPGASTSQILDVLGLSPVRQQRESSPMDYFSKFFKFESKSGEDSLKKQLVNGNGLTSILYPTNNTSIVQRSFLNGFQSNNN